MVSRHGAAGVTQGHLGSIKANVGHAEPAAGASGLLKLAVHLEPGRVAPNAQLRVLNARVIASFGDDVASVLDVQIAQLSRRDAECPSQEEAALGGVSSFGFTGTIAHAVLQCTTGIAVDDATVGVLLLATRYRRVLIPWAPRRTRADARRSRGGSAKAGGKPSTSPSLRAGNAEEQVDGLVELERLLAIGKDVLGTTIDADECWSRLNGRDRVYSAAAGAARRRT